MRIKSKVGITWGIDDQIQLAGVHKDFEIRLVE